MRERSSFRPSLDSLTNVSAFVALLETHRAENANEPWHHYGTVPAAFKALLSVDRREDQVDRQRRAERQLERAETDEAEGKPGAALRVEEAEVSMCSKTPRALSFRLMACPLPRFFSSALSQQAGMH